MEKILDRKEYRRSLKNEKEIEQVRTGAWYGRIKRFLVQTLCAATVLLGISLLKRYNYDEILEKIKGELNKEVSISALQEKGQRIYEVACNSYAQLDDLIEEALNSESGEEIKHVESSTSIVEEQYEMAVEGINQMSEDIKYINENYEFLVPTNGTVTSRFGVRNSSNPKVSHYHSGLDIAANVGTQIIAAVDGEVVEVESDAYFGKYLKVKKDDMEIIYAHCSKIVAKVGNKVKKGEVIAYVGNTGNSTGPHLHFELKLKDRLINPEEILNI